MILFILFNGHYITASGQATTFDFSPKNPLVDDLNFKFEVTYFDPRHPEATQLVLLIKRKNPFGIKSFVVGLSPRKEWDYKEAINGISYRSGYELRDTILFEPLRWRLPTDKFSFYLSISGNEGTDINPSFYGPLTIWKSNIQNVEIIGHRIKADLMQAKPKITADKRGLYKAEFPKFIFEEHWAENGPVFVSSLISNFETGGKFKEKYTISLIGTTQNTLYYQRVMINIGRAIVFSGLDSFKTLKQDIVEKFFILPDTFYIGKTSEGNFKMNLSTLIKLMSENRLIDVEAPKNVLDKINSLKVTIIDPSGNENFSIFPLNTDIQYLNDNLFTNWKWTIKPLSPGKAKLRLTLSLLINEQAKDIEFPFGEKEVIILDNRNKMLLYFDSHQEFIIGALLVPIILFVVPYLKRKKKRKKNLR